MLLVLKFVWLFTDEVSAVLVPDVEEGKLSTIEKLRSLNASPYNASTSDSEISSSKEKQRGDETLWACGVSFNEATVASKRSKSITRLSGRKADEAVIETADISWKDSCCERLSGLE